MKKLMMLVLGVLLLLPAINASASPKETRQDLYVDVSAATLWTAPDILRPVDYPSAGNPADLWSWTKSMTLAEKEQLSGDGMLETQALYGNKVTVTDRKGDWVKVAVHGQGTPRDERGYPGWMPARQLAYSKKFAAMEKAPFVLVIKPTAMLYKDKHFKKEKLEISYNTRLPALKKTKGGIEVVTPEGKKAWLKQSDGHIYQSEKDIPAPSGEDLVNSGKQFIGLPYLWAGMSGFGFDCSGFTFTMYQSHGISIPRDSTVQAVNGKPVAEEDLQPGDLLFFAHDNGKGKVHHVAMYAGDGMMIHSPNSKRTVELIPFHTKGYIEEFAGARRYLP
ncbi:C40 family peptidase [Metabacillus sp. GX 13764]|uniref:C40 family peptidase n=1 Tax=Metabacillus kandeliae TaxID=2900151 RepID=UPI001E2F2C59|nr:C40 family peptidase [Metabacillus kandeliae]MCD7035069.1 C40 family peptidase [Metabacillus kandeliae]